MQCVEYMGDVFTIPVILPTDINDCTYVVLTGGQAAQLNNLLFQASQPIDYSQSATAFGVVFVATLAFYFAVFQGQQLLKVVGLAKRI